MGITRLEPSTSEILRETDKRRGRVVPIGNVGPTSEIRIKQHGDLGDVVDIGNIGGGQEPNNTDIVLLGSDGGVGSDKGEF